MLELELPNVRALAPQRFSFGVNGSAVVEGLDSPTGGAGVTPAIAPRWRAEFFYNNASMNDQAIREAFFSKISGQRNFLRFHHLARPLPRGTLRGTPTLASALAFGATSCTITAQAGSTLLRGDMLGLGANGQVVMVSDDAQESGGQMVVNFVGPVRAQNLVIGTAIVWDKPKMKWISTDPDFFFPYNQNGTGSPFSVSFVEFF